MPHDQADLRPLAARRLGRRLAQLRRVLDLDAVVRQPSDVKQVVAYYHQNFHPYRRYHSAAGAMHMALNPDGRFDADGFLGQARRVEALWDGEPPPGDVLEIAFGKGINLAYLAPRWPEARFAGIDLTPRNVRHARSLPELAEARLACGDLEALPFKAQSFDVVFCVEGFTYAKDLAHALAEQARVLRPGGRLVLFDGFRERPLEALHADEALAVVAVEKAMAVVAFPQVEMLVAAADAAGLDLASNESLVAAITPNLRRMDRMASVFLLVAPLARRWLAGRSTARGHNLVAAALGRWTVGLGLHGYRQLVLRKR